ncbi:hypothetical protein GA0115257_12124 [Streptomyces sp. LcepLS]|nr:hypothetical protein GA0115257_12124 [Streptomyces sp. LcepLS]
MRDFAMPHHGDDHTEGPADPGPLPRPLPGRGAARGYGAGPGPREAHGAGSGLEDGPGDPHGTGSGAAGRHRTGDAPEAGETGWGTGVRGRCTGSG